MASAVACNANASASSSTSSLLIDGVDIDTCTDDYKLNEMVRTAKNRQYFSFFLFA